MNELPQIAIQICTYNRYEMLQDVVKALQNLIVYPAEKITLYICDDSSPDNYSGRLKKLKMFKEPWKTVFLSTKENGGWGRNVNNGLHQIKEDLIFFCEDDYSLTRELDLRVGVALMLARTNIGMLRYRGTAGDHLVYHQFEADLDAFVPDNFMYMEAAGSLPNRCTYLQFDSGSHTLWLYSHGPHLKRRAFHEIHGLYPEGFKLGETEEKFAHIVKDNMRNRPYDMPAIAIQPDWIGMHWDHIGQSYQGSEFDK